jgi:hypothetical protein
VKASVETASKEQEPRSFQRDSLGHGLWPIPTWNRIKFLGVRGRSGGHCVGCLSCPVPLLESQRLAEAAATFHEPKHHLTYSLGHSPQPFYVRERVGATGDDIQSAAETLIREYVRAEQPLLTSSPPRTA